VNYDLAQYPVAQRHCDTHVCLGEPIRYPNGSDVIEGLATAFAKVMGNLREVDAIE
jgi:hypothetical protein